MDFFIRHTDLTPCLLPLFFPTRQRIEDHYARVFPQHAEPATTDQGLPANHSIYSLIWTHNPSILPPPACRTGSRSNRGSQWTCGLVLCRAPPPANAQAPSIPRFDIAHQGIPSRVASPAALTRKAAYGSPPPDLAALVYSPPENPALSSSGGYGGHTAVASTQRGAHARPDSAWGTLSPGRKSGASPPMSPSLEAPLMAF